MFTVGPVAVDCQPSCESGRILLAFKHGCLGAHRYSLAGSHGDLCRDHRYPERSQKKLAHSNIYELMTINPDQDLTLMQAVRLGFASYHVLYRLVRTNKIPSCYRGGLRVVRARDVLEAFGEPGGETTHQVVLGVADLALRWRVSIQAIHKKLKEDNRFPEPLGRINRGRFPVWDEFDIKCYEARGTGQVRSHEIRQNRINEWLAEKKPALLRRRARNGR
jgi:hypothetical protein